MENSMQIFIYAILKYFDRLQDLFSDDGEEFLKTSITQIAIKKGSDCFRVSKCLISRSCQFEIEKIPRKIEDQDDSDILLSFEKKIEKKNNKHCNFLHKLYLCFF